MKRRKLFFFGELLAISSSFCLVESLCHSAGQIVSIHVALLWADRSPMCICLGASSVRGFGSVKPSPPRSRESAQCILDVFNLEPEPVKKENWRRVKKRTKCWVHCAGRETRRETRDGMRKCFGHTIQLEVRLSV